MKSKLLLLALVLCVYGCEATVDNALEDEKEFFYNKTNELEERISILDNLVWQIANTGGCGCWEIQTEENIK